MGKIIYERVIHTKNCMFDFEKICTILTAKKCEGCKFRKTEKEFETARLEAEKTLVTKGPESVAVGKGLDAIITTRKVERGRH